MMKLTSTKSLWLAAFFLSRGLRFAKAERASGDDRAKFFFEDPESRGPELARQYREDTAMQRLISARQAMGRIVGVTRARGECGAADVVNDLRMIASGGARDDEAPPALPMVGCGRRY